MSDSTKHPYSLKFLITVITVLVSIVGYLASQLWDGISAKLETVDSNKETLVRFQEKLNSDEAQWRLIKEQNEEITLLKVEVEVLERLVTTYSSNDQTKVVTLKIEGLRDANSMDAKSVGKPAPVDDPFDDGGDFDSGDSDLVVEPPPPPPPEVEGELPQQQQIQEYKRILDDAERSRKRTVNDYKNQAIQLQRR
jgi:hypothetical protein